MAYNQNTLPGAHGTGLTEDSYESGRTHGLAQPTGLGLGQTQPQGAMKGGLTGSAGEVCDAPGIYNAANATKTVHHVNDDRRERQYEAAQVEETIVHHDIERVKPVLHQEVHQTRLHEVTHHKVEPVRDLGVVEVVHHRDTDACGNVITSDFNAVRGVGHGGIVENIKDKLTGHHDTHATTGMMSGTTAYDSTHTTNTKPGIIDTIKNTVTGTHPTGTTGYNTTSGTDYNTTTNTKPGIVETIKNTVTGAHPTGTTGYNTTSGTEYNTTTNTKPGIVENIKNTITGTHPTTGTTGATGYNTAPVTTPLMSGTHNTTDPMHHNTHGTTAMGADAHKPAPGGIKGLINKVIPGPGPF